MIPQFIFFFNFLKSTLTPQKYGFNFKIDIKFGFSDFKTLDVN